MTYDFALPEKYKVNKLIDKEQFINNANSTQAERRDLNKYLKSVSILYDVKFADDSELIFLDVDISVIANKYTMANISYCVASSLPYRTVVLVRCGKRAKIFSFNSKKNTKNFGRMTIVNYSGTPYFNLGSYSSFLPNYSEIVRVSRSAELCCQCLVKDTNDRFTDHNKIMKEECRKANIEIKRILHSYGEDEEIRYRHYEYNDDNYHGYEEYDYCNGYDDGHKRFVYDCANYCYGLYLEYFVENELECESEDEIEDVRIEWLAIYVDVCSELAQLMSFEEISNFDLIEIFREFEQQRDFRMYRYRNECFDADELRELLDEYYSEG